MHVFVIIAFAVLLWRTQSAPTWRWVAEGDVLGTLASVAATVLLPAAVALWTSAHARKLFRLQSGFPGRAIEFHHRATFILRCVLTGGFAATVLLTRWGEWFSFGRYSPALQGFGDLVILSPFVIGCLLLWCIAFPLERRFRGPVEDDTSASLDGHWRFSAYLDFNLRHHLLVVAVPMTIILFAADLTEGYGSGLRRAVGWNLAPEAALAVVAMAVFLFAPLMLRRIWRTTSLPPGPLRQRLEELCRRIGLRCRDILIWRSDGIMINAAVMGIVPGVRYVLLSDALLSVMSARQIEAVFGHEAGHIRHRHIQHFLAFAFVGWAAVAALMEGLAWGSMPQRAAWSLSLSSIESIGVVATVLFWGLGFGWVSRRFERQADLFGARCVTPSLSDCDRPCSVHLDGEASRPSDGRVCATAAAVFASALDRVAALNGIPSEERSWRHSSIGSRIRFLTALAGDPARAVRFERGVRRIKAGLAAAAVLAAATSVFYWIQVPQPALLQLQAGVR